MAGWKEQSNNSYNNLRGGGQMPAKSVAQFRFMKGVQAGSIKAKGLTPAKASEYVSGQSPKGLPKKLKKSK